MLAWTASLALCLEARIDQSNAVKRYEQEKTTFERMKPNYAVFKTFEETNRKALDYAKKWMHDAHCNVLQKECKLHKLTAELIPQWTKQDVPQRPAVDHDAIIAELRFLRREMTTKDRLIADLTTRIVSLEKKPVAQQVDPKVMGSIALAADTAKKVQGLELVLDRVVKDVTEASNESSRIQAELIVVEAGSNAKHIASGQRINTVEARMANASSKEEQVALNSTLATTEIQLQQVKSDLGRLHTLVSQLEKRNTPVSATPKDKDFASVALDDHVSRSNIRIAALETKDQQHAQRLVKAELDSKQTSNQISALEKKFEILHNDYRSLQLKSIVDQFTKFQNDLNVNANQVRTTAEKFENFHTNYKALQTSTISERLAKLESDCNSNATQYPVLRSMIHNTEMSLTQCKALEGRLKKVEVDLEQIPITSQNSVSNDQVKLISDKFTSMKKELETDRARMSGESERRQDMLKLVLEWSETSKVKMSELDAAIKVEHERGTRIEELLKDYAGEGAAITKASMSREELEAKGAAAPAINQKRAENCEERAISTQHAANGECNGNQAQIPVQGIILEVRNVLEKNIKTEFQGAFDSLKEESDSRLTGSLQQIQAEARQSCNYISSQLRKSFDDEVQKLTTSVTALEQRIEQRIAASINPAQAHELRELRTLYSGMARGLGVMQQQYNNITTEAMAQQMLNMLCQHFPAPVNLQTEANRFADARRDLMQRVAGLEAQFVALQNTAQALNDSMCRQDGRVSALQNDMGTARHQIQEVHSTVGKLDENVQQLQNFANGTNSSTKKLCAFADYIAQQHGYTLMKKAMWADDDD